MPPTDTQDSGAARGAIQGALWKPRSPLKSSQATFTSIYDFRFSPDGYNPQAPLLYLSRAFYGTTSMGGTSNLGTVYSVTAGGSETVLHSFQGSQDGATPLGGLIDVDGTLFGTTSAGGSNGNGTIFKITPAGNLSLVHSFGVFPDGATPMGELLSVNGELFGTTRYGGAYQEGTVFKIRADGTEKVIHSFGNGSDGAQPEAGLVHYKDAFYGTTVYGGSTGFNYGTIFTVHSTGRESVIHNFDFAGDGAHPFGSLDVLHGTLYGTALYGGPYLDQGIVYALTRSGQLTTLHSFGADGDGSYPTTGVIDYKGELYGTTSGTSDGNNYGTLFAVSPSGAYKLLYTFTRFIGARPNRLTARHNVLYGTTQGGGEYEIGNVFSLTDF